VEFSPESLRTDIFEESPKQFQSRIIDAEPILRNIMPDSVHKYWKDLDSFKFLVHTNTKAMHPISLWNGLQIGQYIKKLNPALIHLDVASMRVVPLLPKIHSIPIILNIHDTSPHTGENNWRINLARSLIFSQINKFILFNNNDRFLFCSEYKVPETKVATLPLGVYKLYRNWINTKPEEKYLTLLFFGRLSPYKGLQTLFQAATIISQKIPNVRIIVAGKPIPGYKIPETPVLLQEGIIEILDRYIRNEELANLFQKATIVVCPYTDATQSAVVLTSYAFGKPVVATAVGGLPEYIDNEETGYLVQPRDPKALAEAIIKLLQEPETRERMRKNIYLKAEFELSWKKIAENTKALYHSILEK
jgi:glycosyltransferase involved in cell wall biosynthesis